MQEQEQEHEHKQEDEHEQELGSVALALSPTHPLAASPLCLELLHTTEDKRNL